MTALDEARTYDASDPFYRFRAQFHHPQTHGPDTVYLCGNSLGLQPLAARQLVLEELDAWQHLAVDGHFEGARPWYDYHEQFARPLADVVGARPHEVVAAGSLTTNLHLLMVSFYRPTAHRYKIVIEENAFPSDRYAVASQAAFHGYDPADAIVELASRPGESTLRTEDVEQWLAEHGEQVALVLFGGVNYYSGQVYDMQRITAAGHAVGAVVGFDLAHAVGNVWLKLHRWRCDFAAWCSYKYLNSGPGSVGGMFVHDRWADAPELPRFAGWWGNDPATRFEMPAQFAPQRGAAGWQLSNAPVLSMAAHKAALDIFTEAPMPALVTKQYAMMQFLLRQLDAIDNDRFEVLTPRDPDQRAGQLSLRVHDDAEALFKQVQARGIVCDFRRPDVIRIGVAPLYNSYEDVYRFADALATASATH